MRSTHIGQNEAGAAYCKETAQLRPIALQDHRESEPEIKWQETGSCFQICGLGFRISVQTRLANPEAEFTSNGLRLSRRVLLVSARTKSYSMSKAADLNPAAFAEDAICPAPAKNSSMSYGVSGHRST